LPKLGPDWEPSRLVHRRYTVKVVPPQGRMVWRLEFSSRWVTGAGMLAGALVVALAAGSFGLVAHAESLLRELRVQNAAQADELHALDKQTNALDSALRELREQNSELRNLIGAPAKPAPSADRRSMGPSRPAAAVAFRLATLRSAAESAAADQHLLHDLALRVLNLRHLAAVTRARTIAAIPSIRPVDFSEVTAGFGWRTNPWPEFHKGVDLAADYGSAVRAGAAGTVTFAGWDGGFGQKVEIDHHNGYQTWYAHLSRIDVRSGESVTKGRVIAAVGMSGETTGPHLHYQIMLNGAPIDPQPYIGGIPPRVFASIK
jgi:murein DD-endopeptidase MepM/ murein hydrolase activator NlpD